MVNVRELGQLGENVPYETGQEAQDTRDYDRLEDEVCNSADGIEIAELRQRPYGILLIATEDLRSEHPVIGDAHAVLWHTDNDMHDAESGIRLVDEPTATKLRTECASVLINDIVEHYKKCPIDDGNPAYRLFRNWLFEHDHETDPTPSQAEPHAR